MFAPQVIMPNFHFQCGSWSPTLAHSQSAAFCQEKKLRLNKASDSCHKTTISSCYARFFLHHDCRDYTDRKIKHALLSADDCSSRREDSCEPQLPEARFAAISKVALGSVHPIPISAFALPLAWLRNIFFCVWLLIYIGTSLSNSAFSYQFIFQLTRQQVRGLKKASVNIPSLGFVFFWITM